MTTATFQELIDERKALKRALEDYQESICNKQIEVALLEKAIEGHEELLKDQLARNVRAKKRNQEMSDLADEEKAKADRFFEVTLKLNKGTLSRVTRLAAAKLKEVKDATKLRKEYLERNLSEQVDEYVKLYPSGQKALKNLQKMDIDLARDKRTINVNNEKITALRSRIRSERQLTDGMFPLIVVDAATSVLRYHDLVNHLKNPNAHKLARERKNTQDKDQADQSSENQDNRFADFIREFEQNFKG